MRTTKVRFLRPVKMGGRWYLPGEEALLSAKIAREFAKRGLVEKLTPKRPPSKRGVRKGE